MYTENNLPRKLLEILETSNWEDRGQVIRTVKYADDIVLLAKEKSVLQGKYFVYSNIQ
jgi:hypothetical protein